MLTEEDLSAWRNTCPSVTLSTKNLTLAWDQTWAFVVRLATNWHIPVFVVILSGEHRI
jgi:hypothetical protein